MTANSNQELINSLRKQRQGVKQQLDAATDKLLTVSGSERVRSAADRDNLADQLRVIDSQLRGLEQAMQAEEDALQRLIFVLSTFSVNACSFMVAYQRALLSRAIAPNLGDVESLIRHLVSDLNEPSANRTLYRFVVYLVYLSEQLKLPVSLVEDLKQWVRDTIPAQELVAIKTEVEHEQDEHSNQKNCLLIKVYSSSIDEYHIKAWYIPDRITYRQNWPEGAKLVQIPGSEIDTTDELSLVGGSKPDLAPENLGNLPFCSTVEIKAVIQAVHQQCCQDYNPPELVEIFLPKQLMNSDIDSWRLQEDRPRPLFGTRYPVILRSSDRLTKRYLCKRAQEKKWEAVERLLTTNTNALSTFCEGDPADIDELYCQGEVYSVPDKPETKDVVGLKLTQPASVADDELEDIFETVLMDSALPIMIWARHLEVGLECPASIDKILGCVLRQLPEDLKFHRLEAFKRRQSNRGCHIGNHLSLLWDDPQLVPPDSK